jgi:adenylyltransferase/sulfurtransferase
MNDDELLRYSRHILLPDIDVSGQDALIASRVLIVGMGGLGCPIALYLAASGVGHITICDDDDVEITNLQRQIAHWQSDIGKPKVQSAEAKMMAMNSHCNVTAIQRRLSSEELTDMADDIDQTGFCTSGYL